MYDGRDQRRMYGSGHASYVVVIGGGQRTRRESDPRAWVEEQKSVSTERSSLLSLVGVRAKLRAACCCGLARVQETLSLSLSRANTSNKLSPTSRKQLADRVAEGHRGLSATSAAA
jgi:hypothetical protein